MRTRAKMKCVASDRARRENVRKHILFPVLFQAGFNNRVSVVDEEIRIYFNSIMLIICQLLNLLNQFPHKGKKCLDFVEYKQNI